MNSDLAAIDDGQARPGSNKHIAFAIVAVLVLLLIGAFAFIRFRTAGSLIEEARGSTVVRTEPLGRDGSPG